MQNAEIRLDDAARAVVHFFPLAVMELFDPVEEPCPVSWHKWRPTDDERMPPWFRRTQLRRLDTQLAPTRWIPDAGYVCVVRSVDQVWGWELQSRWRDAPPARAGTCLIQLWRQGDAVLAVREVELRLIQVRTLEAPMPNQAARRARRGARAAAMLPGSFAEPPNRIGLVQFVSTDVLLRLDPDDRRFAHPWCWPLVCLSRQVSADHILLRHTHLLDLEAAHARSFVEIRLLLGLVGRARFPKDGRFVSMMELAMNDATTKDVLNLGYLTDQERNRLLLEATARQTEIFNERLQAAKDEGELKGRLEVARKLLSSTRPADEVERAMAHLSSLKTPDAIDDVLVAWMAGRALI